MGIEFRWGEIFRTSPDRPWGPPSLLYNGYRVFPGDKERPGRDADLSPPSSAEAMKEWSYTSTPPMGRTACTEPQCLYKGCTLPYLTLLPNDTTICSNELERMRKETVVTGSEAISQHLRSSSFCHVTRRTFVVSHRCFGATYGYHIQGSSTSNFLDCVTTEDGTHIGCPKTSVTNCQSAMRNILEERGTRLHRGKSLKSRVSRRLHGGTEEKNASVRT